MQWSDLTAKNKFRMQNAEVKEERWDWGYEGDGSGLETGPGVVLIPLSLHTRHAAAFKFGGHVLCMMYAYTNNAGCDIHLLRGDDWRSNRVMCLYDKKAAGNIDRGRLGHRRR